MPRLTKERCCLPVRHPALLFDWLKELLFLVLYVLSGLLGYLVTLESLNRHPTRTVSIVFVHGWCTQNPLYLLLKRRLERDGFSVHLTNFGLHIEGFDRTADRLATYLERQRLREVVLVGASGGALICLAFLQHLNGWRYVRRFVSIGGPYRGAPLALLAGLTRTGRQMAKGSAFLTSLSSAGVEHPERIVCLLARCDELVPSWSSWLPGAENHVLDVVGHVNLQAFARATHEAISHQAGIAEREGNPGAR